MSDFKKWSERIKTWSKKRQEFRAVVIVGSQARLQPPADEFSDLDLVLYCSNAEAYAAQAGWLEAIGAPWLAVRSTTGQGDPEWMVVFEGGDKVDFVFASLPQELKAIPLMEVLQRSPYGFVFQRGVRVLFDRQNPESEGRFLSFPPQPPPEPEAEEFSQVVQRFLLQALRAARFLRRGETWRAARLINGGMKDPYLTMLEWHARCARSGVQPVQDTWYEGHFLERWVDPRVLSEMPGLFAACEPDALWKALYASLEAMRRVARETASRLGWEYPENLDSLISGQVHSLRRP